MVGHDTLNYMDYDYIKHRGTSLMDFRNLEISDLGSHIEILNNSMCSVIHNNNLSPRYLIVFYSIITFLFLSLAAKKQKLPLSIFLSVYVLQGFYFESFNVARQFCAISVIFYAVSFLKYTDKKQYYFFLWSIIAILIHSFAVVCLPFYFLYRIHLISRFFLLLSYISCLFLLVLKFDIISNLSLFLTSDKITSYMDNYGGEEGLNIIGILYNWIYISILYYFFIVYKKKCVVDDTLCFIYIMSLLIYSAVINYGGIIGRIHFYFSFIQVILISALFSKHIIKLSQLDKIALVLYVFFACYRSIGLGSMLESEYYLSFF